MALWNGVDCSSLLMSRSRRIPRRSCRTIPRGDKLDGLLGTKTCLCCTTAPATVRWESLLATQGQLPACSRQLRSPAPATVRWVGTSCGVYQCETPKVNAPLCILQRPIGAVKNVVNRTNRKVAKAKERCPPKSERFVSRCQEPSNTPCQRVVVK